jgi:hypothetical protein
MTILMTTRPNNLVLTPYISVDQYIPEKYLEEQGMTQNDLKQPLKCMVHGLV